jgi:hypothetical protein
MRLGRVWSIVATSLLMMGAVTSCSGGGGDEADGGSGGGDGDAASGDVEVTDPLQVSYVHESDSEGGDSGYDEVRMAFEPDGSMFVIATGGETASSAHGAYELADDKLKIAVASNELSLDVDATFDLDLNESEVSMPFQVSSTAKGTSTWTRAPMDVMFGTLLVMDGSRYDEAGVEREAAVQRAQAYADARVEVDGGAFGEGAGGSGKSSGGNSAPARSDGIQLISAQASNANPVVDTLPYGNGVTLVFKDGTKVDVILYTNRTTASGPMSLRKSPIADDPRVNIATVPPGNGSADPSSKIASLINPFLTEFGETSAVAEATTDLKKAGYTVDTVSDKAANFEGITELLLGKSGKPGFITLSSHGGTNGTAMTSEYLGPVTDLKTDKPLVPKMRPIAERIDKAYPGSRAYTIGGKSAQPFSIGILGTSPLNYKGWVALSESYFPWLEATQKADFSDATFFLSTCEGDKLWPGVTQVREKIKAEVFLGFDEQMGFDQATTTFAYLVKQLVRPTRSAEEAYYNLVRVVNTKQMIYPEDKLFDGIGNTPVISEALNAYGRTPEVVYFGNGFLDRSVVNQGQVWWLTFAGRWSGDTANGATVLLNCWDEFWSKGNKGGLASPLCNASNAGDLPKVDEVSYAIYLLTGTKTLTYSGTTVPRWTLADSRTA